MGAPLHRPTCQRQVRQELVPLAGGVALADVLHVDDACRDGGGAVGVRAVVLQQAAQVEGVQEVPLPAACLVREEVSGGAGAVNLGEQGGGRGGAGGIQQCEEAVLGISALGLAVWVCGWDRR